jgi:trigger factor
MMQVTETLSEGLKRAYKVVLPMQDLSQRLEAELVSLKDKVRINGFRPGKVPMAHMRKAYGRQVMSDVLQNAVNEANQKIVSEHGLKLANSPNIEVEGGEEGVKRAIEAEGDLAFTVSVEVLPKFDIGSFDDVVLERLVAKVPDSEIDVALERMASQTRPFSAREGAAANGDKLTIDFVGKIDGEAFEGGAGEGMDLVLGSGQFIPGFEDQLVGASAGESRVVNVKFPDAYQAAHLAGKDASFDVTVKEVAAPGELVMDDEFAKTYGLESLDKLKDAVRANMQTELDGAARGKMKRALLDQLDKRFTFELPESLVEQEFNGVWQSVLSEQQRSGKSFADENTTEEAARVEYRGIAERRVRLGLVMAEIGQEAKVEVTDDEMTSAIVDRARQFPGQEKMIWEFYQKNQEALAQIRAPIYEEKVVDIIVSKSKVTDKEISKEDLLKIVSEDEASAK